MLLQMWKQYLTLYLFNSFLQPTVPAEGRLPPRIGNIGHLTRISNKLVQLGNSNNEIQAHLQVYSYVSNSYLCRCIYPTNFFPFPLYKLHCNFILLSIFSMISLWPLKHFIKFCNFGCSNYVWVRSIVEIKVLIGFVSKIFGFSLGYA